MAGIYLHIPFCRTRCVYCDFYSTTGMELKERYVDALCRELRSRKEYLEGEPVKTVYLGGGTPSQLSAEDFARLFETIDDVYGMNDTEEVTLEANPDDLTPGYLRELSALPFNRLSIGMQTFDDGMLRLLRRRHTSAQAMEVVRNAREAGFANISVDLMYGLPGETQAGWKHDLDTAVSLNVEHISAYHLTYEEGTPLYRMLQKGQVGETDEEQSLLFFSMLMERLKEAGYEHYEISNFCKPGKHSRHNSSYWQGVPYLGCGASAHSYNKVSREWNADNILLYIYGVESDDRPRETEWLNEDTRYNDFIITSLRTRRGISLDGLKAALGEKYAEYCLRASWKYRNNGELELKDNHLVLSRKGLFISDAIMSDLLYVPD